MIEHEHALSQQMFNQTLKLHCQVPPHPVGPTRRALNGSDTQVITSSPKWMFTDVSIYNNVMIVCIYITNILIYIYTYYIYIV